MRYVYIFLRVLVAAAVATDVYRLFDPKYLIGQISTAIFGQTLAVIILLARRKDIRRIVRGSMTCLICVFIGGFLFFFMSIRPVPPGRPGDEVRFVIAGVILGMILAILLISRPQPD